MTTVVVGGHAKKVGKTSVVASLIAAFPEYSWTAIKISPHEHGINLNAAKEHSRAGEEHTYSILEERKRDGNSDTSRFLAAGASRSLWVCVRPGQLESAMPRLLPIIRSDPYVIIESNAILRFIRPDLYIMVLRFDIEDFKDSARELLRQADAAVVVNSGSIQPAWKEIPREAWASIQLFPTTDPGIVPKGLLDLMRSRLHAGK